MYASLSAGQSASMTERAQVTTSCLRCALIGLTQPGSSRRTTAAARGSGKWARAVRRGSEWQRDVLVLTGGVAGRGRCAEGGHPKEHKLFIP